MKVYGTIREKVDIDPIDVIEKLIKNEIGEDWVFEEEGYFFQGFEVRGGNHGWDDKKGITKEFYDHIMNLTNVLNYLKNKK